MSARNCTECGQCEAKCPYNLDIRNVMREDRGVPGLTQDRALANAPDKASGHYKVPKIIE